MIEGITVLTVALFLAVANERLVEWFIAPLFEKFKWDTLWLRYVAGLTGGVISVTGSVNLVSGYVENQWLGLILTAFFVGGGSNLVHELFSNANKRASVYASSSDDYYLEPTEVVFNDEVKAMK